MIADRWRDQVKPDEARQGPGSYLVVAVIVLAIPGIAVAVGAIHPRPAGLEPGLCSCIVLMGGYDIETLWEAHNARRTLWALCRRCGHVAAFMPYDLIKRSRTSDQKLWDVSRRLKCKNCGMHVTVLIPGDQERRKRDER